LGAAVGALVTSKTFWKVVLSLLLAEDSQLAEEIYGLIEEEWSGSRIVGFNGYGSYGGMDGNLTSVYDEYFALAAATYQVPQALLKAMAKVESDFNPNAVSGAIKRAGDRIPQNGETPVYVEKVKRYLFFTDMVQGNRNGGQEEENYGEAEGNGEHSGETGGVETGGEIQGAESGNGDGIEEPGAVAGSLEVSGVLLKFLVEERASEFLGWTQTGTHTETEGSGDDEVEKEIVDYAIVVLLEPELSEVKTGYQYRRVTDQTSFNCQFLLYFQDA
jgi:hypothetical protein